MLDRDRLDAGRLLHFAPAALESRERLQPLVDRGGEELDGCGPLERPSDAVDPGDDRRPAQPLYDHHLPDGPARGGRSRRRVCARTNAGGA